VTPRANGARHTDSLELRPQHRRDQLDSDSRRYGINGNRDGDRDDAADALVARIDVHVDIVFMVMNSRAVMMTAFYCIDVIGNCVNMKCKSLRLQRNEGKNRYGGQQASHSPSVLESNGAVNEAISTVPSQAETQTPAKMTSGWRPSEAQLRRNRTIFRSPRHAASSSRRTPCPKV
jgi:hypothetical protein